MIGGYLSTVGIELESLAFSRDKLFEILNSKMPVEMGRNMLSITHDASSEVKADYLRMGRNGISISQHTPVATKLNSYGTNTYISGYELITIPLEIPGMQELIYKATKVLELHGDFTSVRASTHFHTGFTNNLRVMKNMLRIALTLDPVMFRLGGMGGTFRGKSNLSAYARPLLNSVCVRYPYDSPEMESEEEEDEENVDFKPPEILHGNFAQIINPLAALEAKTQDVFWSCFGVNYPGGMDKYHPSRYTASNFYSILAHGTMEFRHCNQSLDGFLIMAIAKFLRATVELSTVLDRKELSWFEPINSSVEIPVGDAFEIVTKILSMAKDKELDFLPSKREEQIIFDTIAESRFEPLPRMPVLCHIKEFKLSKSVADKGKLKLFKNVFSPKQTDIHNITLSSILE